MTHIGSTISIRGDISSHEDLQIDGRISGQIDSREAALTIGADAHIDADIRGLTVTVRGHVVGNISASERIELKGSAEVSGSLSANFIVLADGALFNGRIDMAQRTISAAVAQHRAAQPGR